MEPPKFLMKVPRMHHLLTGFANKSLKEAFSPDSYSFFKAASLSALFYCNLAPKALALGSLTIAAKSALMPRAHAPIIPYVVLQPNYLIAIIEIEESPHPT